MRGRVTTYSALSSLLPRSLFNQALQACQHYKANNEASGESAMGELQHHSSLPVHYIFMQQNRYQLVVPSL